MKESLQSSSGIINGIMARDERKRRGVPRKSVHLSKHLGCIPQCFEINRNNQLEKARSYFKALKTNKRCKVSKFFKISTFKLNFWRMKLLQGKYKHFHNKHKKLMGYNTKAPILIESQKGFQLNSRWQTKKMCACNICLKTSWKI